MKRYFDAHICVIRLIFALLALSCSISDSFAQPNTPSNDVVVPFDLSRLYGANLIMSATNTRRESFEIYAVRTDGAFSYQLYDREVFARTPNPESDTWKTAPIQFLVYDAHSTLWASYSPDPLRVADNNYLDTPLNAGQSVHLKACIWPILPTIANESLWTVTDESNYTLHVKDLPIVITFDARGRLLRVEQHSTNKSGSALHASWTYTGYQNTPNSIFPTALTRSLRVQNKDGSTDAEQTDEFSLKFNSSRQEFAQMIGLQSLLVSMDVRNPKTGDVSLPNGEFLYNEKEVLNSYYKAVGLRNPARTRRTLFAIIAALGLVSVVIIWKKKTA